MNKTTITAVLIGAAGIFLGQLAYAEYQKMRAASVATGA